MIEAGQFYEYQPGGSGIASIVRINRVLQRDLVQCTMQVSWTMIETKIHIGKLGRQLDITDFPKE
jgi:hypothetical protein